VQTPTSFAGEISEDNLTDDGVSHIDDIIKQGDIVQGRILEVDKKTMKVKLTIRPMDVLDTRRSTLKSAKMDPYYDEEAHQKDIDDEVSARRKKAQKRRSRFFAHESFREFTHLQAEQHLSNAQVGDYVLRPSSRGDEYIAVTVKMGPDLFLHLQIKSVSKGKAFDPMAQELFIGSEKFNDIDEGMNEL